MSNIFYDSRHEPLPPLCVSPSFFSIKTKKKMREIERERDSPQCAALIKQTCVNYSYSVHFTLFKNCRKPFKAPSPSRQSFSFFTKELLVFANQLPFFYYELFIFNIQLHYITLVCFILTSYMWVYILKY